MERHAAALSAKQIAGQHELARVRSETESESALRAHAARVKDLREDMHALEAQLGERTAALGNARIGAAESELAHAQASQSLRSSVASAEAAVALLRSEAASSVRNERVGAEQCAQETRVAVIEYGAVQDVLIERSLERGLVGNVYMGKVTRVLPGMQSAFIDIGLERAAFLHVADLIPNLAAKHNKDGDEVAAAPPIERQVFEGQSLLVQVLKDLQ
jgi:hypothetical protein